MSSKEQSGAENAQELEVLFQAIVENVPLMIFVKRAVDLRFELFNRAGEELIGVPRKDMLGKSDADFFPPEQAEFFTAKDRQVLAEGKLVVAEEPIQTASGERWLLTKKIPLFDREGTPVYLLGVSQDITERRESALALQHAKDEALRANQAKSDFLANVSHELRTPLTLMLGPLEQLEAAPELPAQFVPVLGRIRRNASRLHGLVSDLLDVSKAEAEKLTPQLELLDCAQRLSQLSADLADSAAAHALTFSYQGPSAGVFIQADAEMFERIMLNLAGNAMKFTPAGGAVTVKLAVTNEAALIEVIDTGAGIPSESLPLLFERFQQLENGVQRRYGGTGLGLALVREFAKAQGASVGVESEVGVGSRFWLQYERAEAPARVEAGQAARSRPGAREPSVAAKVPERPKPPERRSAQVLPKVVIAEDNEDMRDYIRESLAEQFEVIPCEDGRAALRAIEQHRPSVVVSDVMMPELDGLGLVQILKSREDLKHIPVILLTAAAGRDSAAAGLDMGADDYVAKPFSVKELRARVRAAHRLAEAHATLAATADELRIALQEASAPAPHAELPPGFLEKLLERVERVRELD